MAVLNDIERLKISAQYQRTILAPLGILKADMSAAVNAADDWVENNQSAFVSSLPTAFRTASTANQKLLLLMYILMRRMGWLRVEGD